MSLTPMMQQYFEIKKRYPNTLLFFRLGDFYEMFGDDAKVASRVLEITLTSRDGGKTERLPMCGVPHHAVTGYLEKLVQNGFRVAICEQLEDPKQAKGVVKRDVVRVVTPGTFIEGAADEKTNSFLTAVFPHKSYWGLATVDLSTGEFKVTELQSKAELLDELYRLTPTEVLLPPRLELAELEGLNAAITRLDQRSFILEHAKSALLEHFRISTLEPFGLTQSSTIGAAGVALEYMQETQKSALEHITAIYYYTLDEYLLIDGNSGRNLELTRTIREGRKQGSLLGVLDKTVTSMGARLLKSWLEKPLLDLQEIKRRQGGIGYLKENTLTCMELREALDAVYDMERLLSKLVYGNGNARDLVSLRESLKQIPKLKEVLSSVQQTYLSELEDALVDLHGITDLLDRSIEDNPPISVREGSLIKAGYSEDLDELRTASREGKQWIRDLEKKERERTGIKSLKVGFNKVFGYYIDITKANINNVPSDYTRKQTLANSERFITPELKEKESLILGADERSVELEYQLFCQVRNEIKEHIVTIQKNAHVIAILDVLQSLTQVAVERDFTCPQVIDEFCLDIKDGRHPVIEALQGDFVPNDLVLNEQQRVLLLTGPNMAGKSTYLRQTALIVILAQMGSFVPATSARIGLVDRIFTRIGAADDLSTGQSTFMVECAETAHLVHNATERSLIVLDELGRGTSTYDGMAIAQAVIEHLHNKVRARTLFSTHYHELTKLEQSLAHLITYQVAVEEKNGQVYFLHKVLPGNADKSYGINVAKMAGVPSAIVRRATDLLYYFEAGQQRPVQLDLFQTLKYTEVSEPDISIQVVTEEIENIDINQITPLEALQMLARWKDELKKE